jgi:hypothetical protein
VWMGVCWRQVRARTILKRAPQLKPESLKRPRRACVHTERDPHCGAAGIGPDGHFWREAPSRRGVAGFVSFLPVRPGRPLASIRCRSDKPFVQNSLEAGADWLAVCSLLSL